MANYLTKKDLRKCFIRHNLLRNAPYNYETLQSGNFIYSLQPALEKVYEGQEDVLVEKYKEYSSLYESHPWFSNLILGLVIAFEAGRNPDATQDAKKIRTSLMGLMNGIGTSLVKVVSLLLGVMMAKAAIEGNITVFGIVAGIQVVLWLIFYKLFIMAYEKGIFISRKKVHSFAENCMPLMYASLGLTAALMMKVTLPMVELASPLVTLVTIGIVYFLTTKNIKKSYIMIGIFVISILLGYLGILG